MHHLHHIVYNTVNDSPKSTLHLVIHCAIFLLVVAFCIVMYLGRGKSVLIKLNTGHRVNPFLFALLPIAVFFLINLSIDIMEINVYQHDKAILNSNEVKIVEGTVANYYPEAKDGHGVEEFTVHGVEFHYSHYEAGRSGYHQTALFGGVIRSNLYVKISYYYDGDRNAILKLETE